MPSFAAGVVKFQQEVFPEKRELFEKLSQGQSPEALFITCSDSRIETAMITQTEPGELFIVRNAGNIVPPHSRSTGGVTASIEFAIAALKVPHVVICGHTGCGAMKGALDLDDVTNMPHVKEWLGYTKAAVEVARILAEGKSEEELMTILLEQNVIHQLQHLKTHPAVAAQLAKGALALHGWVYDIKTGMIEAYDEEQGKFLPVSERYAVDAANAARLAQGAHSH